eukprot:1072071-Alexandrium_andersonii.AAC.1
MGLLETAPKPPTPLENQTRRRARGPAYAGAPGFKPALRNWFAPRGCADSERQCSERHPSYEETSGTDMLMPLLGKARLKPEFQGCQRLQVAIDSGGSASVIPENLLNGHR